MGGTFIHAGCNKVRIYLGPKALTLGFKGLLVRPKPSSLAEHGIQHMLAQRLPNTWFWDLHPRAKEREDDRRPVALF